MSSDATRRIEESFEAIAALPPDVWAEQLQERLGGQPELMNEVRSLLDCHARAEGFLDAAELLGKTMAASAAQFMHEEALPEGTLIGDYVLGRLLGVGGMGSVYVARQERPRRTVALKLIRRGLSSVMLLRRFEHEAEVLGRLQHPGIAQIYEAGTAPLEGNPAQPFIAMELVEGLTLTAYAQAEKLTTPQRMELVAKIADAVHHAHQRGVIHRDLKPANIIVDGTGQPKILDFGVARTMGADHAITTMQTGIGQLLGTLPYMSPEQVAGDSAEIDIRSDVYGLGVLLYELLAGRLPYDVRRRSLPEAARIIREDPPSRLSSISRVFRGDTDTIVSKALEKDKSRRYQSAAELRDDIRLYLEGKPIHAKQDSALYVLGKQIKRFRWVFAAAVGLLLGSALFAAYAIREAGIQRHLAASERAARADADASLRRAEDQTAITRRSLYVSNIGFAQAAHASRDVARMLRLLDDCPPAMRGWEWRYLRRIADTAMRVTQMPNGGVPVISTTARADLCGMVGELGPRAAMLYDVPTGKELAQIALADPPTNCALSADGKRMLILNRRLSTMIWDIPGQRLEPLPLTAQAGHIIIGASADLGLVLLVRSNCTGCTARVCETATGRIVKDLGPGGLCGTMSPDGDAVAVGYEDGTVRIVSGGLAAPTSDVTIAAHRGNAWAVAFSPDRQRLATVGFDGALIISDLTGHRLLSMPVCDNKLFDVVWSPDGRYLATAGTDCVIRVIDPAIPRTVLSLTGHSRRVDALFWGKNGIASVARDGFMRWWADPFHDQSQPSMKMAAAIGGALDRAHGIFYACLSDGGISVIDASTLAVTRTIAGVDRRLHRIVLSPDGERLAAVFTSGVVSVINAKSGAVICTTHTRKGRAINACFSPDQKVLAVCGDEALVSLWDATTGERIRELPAPPQMPPGSNGAVAWSADGTLMAVGYGDHLIAIQNAADGRLLSLISVGDSAWTSTLIFSHDASRLFSAHDGGDIYVIDVKAGKVLHRLQGHQNAANHISLSPDETRLISGGWDNTVRLWDVESGLELLTLRKHTSGVQFVDFDASGERATSLSLNGELYVWSAEGSGGKP